VADSDDDAGEIPDEAVTKGKDGQVTETGRGSLKNKNKKRKNGKK
jgi:hypothetical protein